MKNQKLKAKNKNLVLLFLIVFLVFSFPLFSQVEAGGLVPPLVPCGGPENPCQFCDFFVLFDNIFRFVLFRIVPPVAVLMIVIAGAMFISAYFFEGGVALFNQAKKLLTYVIIGLIIIYTAWLIVNLFFQIIGVKEWTGLRTWWEIKCP